MITFLLRLSFILPPFIIAAAAADNQPYNPTDHILLDCGASSNSSLPDGRDWNGDGGTKFSPDINSENISFAARATELDPSLTQTVPYMTARIIVSQFSYNFPVSPGQKILRFFFYPATYSAKLNKTQSFFAVTANRYTLLSNFSAFLAASAQVPKGASLVKEFIINVEETQVLNVTFLPSANSYAFVNGIEVVSTPDNLYMGNHDYGLKLVSTTNILYQFDQNKTAFETVYRLNIGGRSVYGMGDTGMYREWSQDDNFIWGGNQGNQWSNSTVSLQYTSQTPNYSAPTIVYTTARTMGIMSLSFNLTWIFPVDSGFFYLLRLHFCESMPSFINATYQKGRVFMIFINNRTAEPEADVIYWTGGTGIPIFRDFVLFVSNPSFGSRSKQDLFLALHPNVEVQPAYYDAILNGLEIFKLNGSDGHLAIPNEHKEEKKGRGRIGMVFAVVGGVSGGGAIILVLVLFIGGRRG